MPCAVREEFEDNEVPYVAAAVVEAQLDLSGKSMHEIEEALLNHDVSAGAVTALNISNCPDLKLSALHTLTSMLTSVHTLNLSGCQLSTSAGGMGLREVNLLLQRLLPVCSCGMLQYIVLFAAIMF